MTQEISLLPGDLDWALHASTQLLDGKGVEGGAGFPFIQAYYSTWKERDGTPPHEAMRASIVWGARGYSLYVPSRRELQRWLRKNSAFEQEIQAFVGAAVIHELSHFREHQQDSDAAQPAGAAPDDDPEIQLSNYYSHPLESEAHAAQIAYLLFRTGRGADAILSNPVVDRITKRLEPLRGSQWEADYQSFLDDLQHRTVNFLAAFQSPATRTSA